MFNETGVASVVLVVSLPRFGKTLSDAVLFRRYCSCALSTTFVPRPAAVPRPAPPPRPPNPPKPPPKPRPPGPPPPVRPDAAEKFWVSRRLNASEDDRATGDVR